MITKLIGVATLFAAGTILMGATPTLGTTDLNNDQAQATSNTLRCGRRCGGGGGGRCGRRCGGGGGRCGGGGGRCAGGGGGRCARRCGHVATTIYNATPTLQD
jgi:hypothetical protein